MDDVPRFKEACLDEPVVNPNAVERIHVAQDAAVVADLDFGMHAGYGHVVEEHIATRVAAHAERSLVQADVDARLRAPDHLEIVSFRRFRLLVGTDILAADFHGREAFRRACGMEPAAWACADVFGDFKTAYGAYKLGGSS